MGYSIALNQLCILSSSSYSCSLIEKEVPKAILQSLITVATEVLHQTHNAQGFQELMLIMSTLAKAGGRCRGHWPPEGLVSSLDLTVEVPVGI